MILNLAKQLLNRKFLGNLNPPKCPKRIPLRSPSWDMEKKPPEFGGKPGRSEVKNALILPKDSDEFNEFTI